MALWRYGVMHAPRWGGTPESGWTGAGEHPSSLTLN
jgi:hypothetical protein